MNRLRSWMPRLRSILTSGIAWMLFGAVFYLGIHSERTGFVKEVLDPGLKKITLPVLNAFKTAPANIPAMSFTIAAEDMDTLSHIRARALDQGVLTEGKDRWFPVTIEYGKEVLNGKLRLKGGLTDHLVSDKWSYRVKLDSGATILGCNRFSVQHPNTRNFSYEWIFHQALRHDGFTTIEYDFIELNVNGESLGIHAFEEHFHARWTDKSDTLIGPVMKYDDERRLIALTEEPESANDPELHPLAGWFTAPIDAFQLKKILQDPVLSELYQRNVSDLEGFRNGTKSAHDVFDVDRLGRMFALCDLLGGQHAQDWRNLRFARNVGNDRLQPIGFDANAGEPIRNIRALRETRPIDLRPVQDDGFYSKLLNDPAFYHSYIKHSEWFIESDWLVDFLNVINEELKEKDKLLQSEFPRFGSDTRLFDKCLKTVERTLRPTLPLDVRTGPDDRSFEVASLNYLPVHLSRLICERDTVDLDVVVFPGILNGPLEYTRVVPTIPIDGDCHIESSTLGSTHISSTTLPKLITIRTDD